MPRRRRRAAAVESIDEERNLAMRILLHSPKDLFAGVLAFAAVSAIVANAMFLQVGHHPSPMFGSHAVVPLAAPSPVSPLPRPRPAEAEQHVEGGSPPHVVHPQAAPAAAQRAPDPVGDLIRASRRISAVQRVLTDYGYGQLKPTGNMGPDTLAAIQKFERDRKLPLTGQITDRLVHELSAMTGRSID
ncbi:MAG TPA: peptidoglycan-binding domain-containing protein [Nitrobacter sp.]|jgi:hypothetical protein|nr:peptidoglycan-binding domain-containing protein [Nitrobacter sp.]